MAIELKTERQERMIVANLILASKDITRLSRQAYKWISICCGFIAEYNHHGFVTAYHKDYNCYDESLGEAIKRNQDNNQWQNFQPSHPDYEYMMQKKRMYNQICEAI